MTEALIALGASLFAFISALICALYARRTLTTMRGMRAVLDTQMEVTKRQLAVMERQLDLTGHDYSE